jgi:hypothetical protein
MTVSQEILKYINIISPSEVSIRSEDIFYREEYTEIINYLKLLLTDSKDLEIYKYIKPKGTLLLNINQGSEILDYVKLISSNYYLNLIELNYINIFKNPNDFLKFFEQIFEEIENLCSNEDFNNQENGKSDKERPYVFDPTKKTLILLNGKQKFHYSLSINLLDIFVNICNQNPHIYNFLSKNIILVWINYRYEDIVENYADIMDIFDLFIRIPILSEIERETLLNDFAENNTEISFDIKTIVELTEGWEVKEIKKLLKTGILKHYLNSDLNIVSNEITDILINLINSGEIISPNRRKKTTNNKIKEKEQGNQIYFDKGRKCSESEIEVQKRSDIRPLIQEIRDSTYSDFMKEQLYENAASQNYSELIIIIDKLDKNEPLEENDRKILSKYPFILNERPTNAKLNLEKGKKRIDLIKKSLGQ